MQVQGGCVPSYLIYTGGGDTVNEIIPMPVIVEGEEYEYFEEENADEVIGSLLAGVDGMEWKDDIRHCRKSIRL